MEKKTLEFRLDLINAFNHVLWDNPSNDINSSNFGRILETQAADALGRSREFRFGLRLAF